MVRLPDEEPSLIESALRVGLCAPNGRTELVRILCRERQDVRRSRMDSLWCDGRRVRRNAEGQVAQAVLTWIRWRSGWTGATDRRRGRQVERDRRCRHLRVKCRPARVSVRVMSRRRRHGGRRM